jgi:hypothetical protein
MGRPLNMHFIMTPGLTNLTLRIVGGGLRGGAQGEFLDLGWLELHGRAARARAAVVVGHCALAHALHGR